MNVMNSFVLNFVNTEHTHVHVGTTRKFVRIEQRASGYASERTGHFGKYPVVHSYVLDVYDHFRVPPVVFVVLVEPSRKSRSLFLGVRRSALFGKQWTT
jgi:hypothetical protein